MNLNFNTERNGKYPSTVEQVASANNEQILEWINTLQPPASNLEVNLFNEIFNQYTLRGGK